MSTELHAAQRYIEIGRPQRALESLAGLDSDAATTSEARRLRGYAFLALENFGRAANTAAEGLADDPGSIDLLYLLSLAEERRDKLPEAEAACVLFIDEIDAIAYARRKQAGSAGRALVDQLLQELDAIGSDNQDMLVLAATNAPWDVDDALKRPGRFDRVVFVSPPDVPARRRILELAVADRPQADLDLDRLADKTALFSGADLRSLVERATDAVIDEVLDRGGDVPIRGAHLERALRDLRPTTTDWLRTARNYVEFANHGGRYDDVLAYLGTSEGKAARSR